MHDHSKNQHTRAYENLISSFDDIEAEREKARFTLLDINKIRQELVTKGVPEIALNRKYNINYEDLPVNALIDQLINIVSARTCNEDRRFFRLVSCYLMTKIASNMRCQVASRGFGQSYVNMFAIPLAPSGYGKNFSLNIIEGELMKGFTYKFKNELYPQLAAENINMKYFGTPTAPDKGLPDFNNERLDKSTNKKGKEIKNPLMEDFQDCGPFVYTFDSGTPAGIKQQKNALTLADIGALNCEIDEVGSNLSNNMDMLALFLELFDVGQAKTKLLKNTNENSRDKDFDGQVPTNLLMFGTPARLLDGGVTEDLFYQLLDTGYARRCFFALGERKVSPDFLNQDPTQLYLRQIEAMEDSKLKNLSNYFTKFASREFYNKVITTPPEVEILLDRYRLDLMSRIEKLKESDFIERSELENRYGKTLKLAAVFAFIRGDDQIDEDDLLEAIQIAEDSGEDLHAILNQDKGYMKVARFIKNSTEPVTNTDILESFNWFKGNKVKETITNAYSWGIKNNILITKKVLHDVDFYSHVNLEPTDLNELILSASTERAQGYESLTVKFNELHALTKIPNINICNHTFRDNYRDNNHCEPEVNCMVFDVDGGTQIESFRDIFAKYKFFLHTTKSSTEEKNRFRVYVPLKYKLSLDVKEYKAFMANVMSFVPFRFDEMSCTPAQAWASCATGKCFIHTDGELFDPLPFIEGTVQNLTRQEQVKANKSAKLDRVEAWFLKEMDIGNRNNLLLRYGLLLLDKGLTPKEIEKAVLSLNRKQTTPLDEAEIKSTIFVTINRRFDEPLLKRS